VSQSALSHTIRGLEERTGLRAMLDTDERVIDSEPLAARFSVFDVLNAPDEARFRLTDFSTDFGAEICFCTPFGAG
jgi:DNA-binding transcriptional LysR family regulator